MPATSRYNRSTSVRIWLGIGSTLIGGQLSACDAPPDPTRVPPTVAELAVAPLQTTEQRHQVIAAELTRLGGTSMTFSQLALQAEVDRELVDGFRARIRVKDVVVTGVVDFHTAVQVLRPNELDAQIGESGWTPNFALDGRRRYNTLGAGRRPAGSVERFGVVARFVDLTPGWRWMDFVPNHPASPDRAQP